MACRAGRKLKCSSTKPLGPCMPTSACARINADLAGLAARVAGPTHTHAGTRTCGHASASLCMHAPHTGDYSVGSACHFSFWVWHFRYCCPTLKCCASEPSQSGWFAARMYTCKHGALDRTYACAFCARTCARVSVGATVENEKQNQKKTEKVVQVSLAQLSLSYALSDAESARQAQTNSP